MSLVLSAMHSDREAGVQGLGWSSGLEKALREKRRLRAPHGTEGGRTDRIGWE